MPHTLAIVALQMDPLEYPAEEQPKNAAEAIAVVAAALSRPTASASGSGLVRSPLWLVLSMADKIETWEPIVAAIDLLHERSLLLPLAERWRVDKGMKDTALECAMRRRPDGRERYIVVALLRCGIDVAAPNAKRDHCSAVFFAAVYASNDVFRLVLDFLPDHALPDREWAAMFRALLVLVHWQLWTGFRERDATFMILVAHRIGRDLDFARAMDLAGEWGTDTVTRWCVLDAKPQCTVTNFEVVACAVYAPPAPRSPTCPSTLAVDFVRKLADRFYLQLLCRKIDGWCPTRRRDLVDRAVGLYATYRHAAGKLLEHVLTPFIVHDLLLIIQTYFV